MLVQQHVLRLQVAVHHCVLTRVQELHAFGDLRVGSDEPELRGTVRLIANTTVLVYVAFSLSVQEQLPTNTSIRD